MNIAEIISTPTPQNRGPNGPASLEMEEGDVANFGDALDAEQNIAASAVVESDASTELENVVDTSFVIPETPEIRAELPDEMIDALTVVPNGPQQIDVTLPQQVAIGIDQGDPTPQTSAVGTQIAAAGIIPVPIVDPDTVSDQPLNQSSPSKPVLDTALPVIRGEATVARTTGVDATLEPIEKPVPSNEPILTKLGADQSPDIQQDAEQQTRIELKAAPVQGSTSTTTAVSATPTTAIATSNKDLSAVAPPSAEQQAIADPLHHTVSEVRLNTHGSHQPVPLSQVSAPQKAIAHQIVAAMSKPNDGTIQIRLDPPELGRITLHITASDIATVASVSADRSEVLDLLRRHETLLQSEMESAGFEHLEFEFSQQSQSGNGEQSEPAATTHLAINETETDSVLSPVAAAMPTSTNQTTLDLRL